MQTFTPSPREKKRHPLATLTLGLTALAAITLAAPQAFASSGHDDGTPHIGLGKYTHAHAANPNPPDRFGGRVIITGKQKGGATQFLLPGPRALDAAIFGTPEHPAGWEQAPFPLIGIPQGMRQQRDGKYTIVDHATPFSDWRMIGTGDLEMKIEDKTAIDGATTKDKVHFRASFDAPDGTHSYRVESDMALPHGFGYPTFGGVVTDHLMHGGTGIGTRLMPTMMTMFSFWAKGDVYVDDRLTNKDQLIHVMLTESVRGKGYKLNVDGQGNGSGQVLHLMIPPYKVTPKGPVKAPLRSGYIPFPQVKKAMMKNMKALEKMPAGPEKMAAKADMMAAKALMGKTKKHVQEAMAAGKMFGMPFFHVMFGNVDYKVKVKKR